MTYANERGIRVTVHVADMALARDAINDLARGRMPRKIHPALDPLRPPQDELQRFLDGPALELRCNKCAAYLLVLIEQMTCHMNHATGHAYLMWTLDTRAASDLLHVCSVPGGGETPLQDFWDFGLFIVTMSPGERQVALRKLQAEVTRREANKRARGVRSHCPHLMCLHGQKL